MVLSSRKVLVLGILSELGLGTAGEVMKGALGMVGLGHSVDQPGPGLKLDRRACCWASLCGVASFWGLRR